MAVATRPQGKTSFVKNFLQKNPQANAKAVNAAWTAAGMKGTISHPVVSGIRKQQGLIGNEPAKTETAVKKKPGTKMSKTSSSPGKSMFVKEFLHDNPRGNVAAVNKAWRDAGFAGTIGKSVVFRVKSSMGLTGNTKTSKTTPTGRKQGRPRKETTAAFGVQPRTNNSGRSVVLNDLEADIDRLIFKAMTIGNLTEIEDSLRQTRRLLYAALK